MASSRALPGPGPAAATGTITGLDTAVATLRAWRDGEPLRGGASDAEAASVILAQNRLLGLAGPTLAARSDDRRVAETIAAFRGLTARMNGESLLLMRKLVRLLADLPVPAVVYKGVLLQEHLYGTPFARPSSDVDILTAPRHYAAVATRLMEAGYALDPHTDTIWWRRFLAEQQFRAPGASQTIDLHHRIQQPGCPLPRAPDRFLAEARRRAAPGGEVLVLRDDHALLVAAMSLVKALHHREPAGRYAADVAWMLDRLSAPAWDAVAAEADLQGVRRTLDLAVRSVDAVFGRPRATPSRPILDEVGDQDLQAMLLAPASTDAWIRRRRLLAAISDRRRDLPHSWLLMAASESARRASPPRERRHEA
jgi:hypothetical protein